MTATKPRLRSDNWFGPDTAVDLRAHHTGKLVNAQLTLEELVGTDHPLADRTVSGRRPLVGICSFGSDLNPCQLMHTYHLADRVAEGIRSAGGIPLRFETAPPLGEPLSRPTTMYLRNLAALTLTETIIANPLDGIVLLTGCDKTVPAGLMGSLLTDIPTIAASVGPMLNGYYHGEQAASGVHLWKNRELLAAGEITELDLMERSCAAQPSAGHCMSMGTASTMNSLTEALGLMLMGTSSIPSPMSARTHASYRTGASMVDMILNDRRPTSFLTRQSFLNAIATNSAIGGSTNAVLHLLAIAKLAGIELTLEDWHKYGQNVPLLLNVKPSGKYLMEEYNRAGGLPAILRELVSGGYVDPNAKWCTGKTLGDELAKQDKYVDREVIRTVKEPLQSEAGIVVLHGNIAPKGAVLKISAVSKPELFNHRGQAYVFNSIEEYQAGIDDQKLDIKPDNVLVLRNCGPLGYPGMPEVGNVRLPGYLLAQGVKAMVTISDARMSGTAYGCHILHVSPEAAIGGPLALIETGDWIELNVKERKLHLDVSDAELEKRQKNVKTSIAPIHSPWGMIHSDPKLGVSQADKGAYLQLYDDPRMNPELIRAKVYKSLRRQH